MTMKGIIMLQLEKDFKRHVEDVIAKIHESIMCTNDRAKINEHSDFLLKMFKVQDTLCKHPELKK